MEINKHFLYFSFHGVQLIEIELTSCETCLGESGFAALLGLTLKCFAVKMQATPKSKLARLARQLN